jgi:hypothetical protein
VLQDLDAFYNQRPHRYLDGNSPVTIDQGNADEIRLDAYLSRGKTKSNQNSNQLKSEKNRLEPYFMLKVGDTVNISQLKHPFQRDYQQKWTEEFSKWVKDTKGVKYLYTTYEI